ncbi:MAG TPA: DUF3429 domain-containing protein [Marinobacterium sp.]|nr:DUF3429 domain-containing protein [Marinobacterium sp.]
MQQFERIQTGVWLGGLAGLIPFYASLYGINSLGWSAFSFFSYAWIILAFLCGAVWRAALADTGARGAKEGLVLALLLPALLWLSWWGGNALQLVLSALGFTLVYVWERFYAWNSYPAGYRVLRTVLTTLVLVAHLLFWLS